LIELWFFVPLGTKYVVSERFPQPISGLVWKKLNLTQRKHAFADQKKSKHKKSKASLVAFLNIRPGNGAHLFSKEKISKGGDE